MRNKDGNYLVEIGHKDSKTIEILEEAVEKGRKLLVKDFDTELLAEIMPLLVWKKEKMMRNVLELVYLNNSHLSRPKITDDDELKYIRLKTKLLKVHEDFQLVLIISDSSQFLSQSLLDNVVVLNNDLGDSEIWNETLLDLIIKKCALKEDAGPTLEQFLESKTKNKVSTEYRKLLTYLKVLNINDLSLQHLSELRTILESIDTYLGADEKEEGELYVPEKIENVAQSLSQITEMSPNFPTGALKDPSEKLSDLNQQKPVDRKQRLDKKTPTQLLRYHKENLGRTSYDHMLQKLELIRGILEQILHVFGDIYEFSEDYYFTVVSQALEVVIYNGYANDRFESMMELFVYQLLLTSLREDHQTLFSFYYSLYFLKEIGQHNKLLWNYFIQGPVQNFDNVTWFQNARIQENWEFFKQVFQECFKNSDSNLPGLVIEKNEYVHMKIKREKEEVSPKKMVKGMMSSGNLSDFTSNVNVNREKTTENAPTFFTTEVNINDPSFTRLEGDGDRMTGFVSNESLSILTRRKHRKSQTLNVRIPEGGKEKGKKYEKKIELCKFILVF